MPSRVVLFDERGFLRPGPTFDLFLSCDCLGRRTMQFVKYKLIYRITFRKSFDLLRFVLLDSIAADPPSCLCTASAISSLGCSLRTSSWDSVLFETGTPRQGISLIIRPGRSFASLRKTRGERRTNGRDLPFSPKSRPN